MFKKTLIILILAVCAIWAGCSEPEEPAPGPSRNSSQSGKPSGGSTARSGGGAGLFRLPMADGQAVTVKTPAALFFFTSWCGYCKQAMPEIKRLTEKARARGWRVYGINVNENPQKVNEFVQQYQPNFPILLDMQGTVSSQYQVKGFPTFVLIDENGNIIYNSHQVPRNF